MAPGPQSSTLVAGQNLYDEADDDAATRVATPHDELAAPPDFQVDDETMTRVARAPAGSPGDAGQMGPKVLPTMPMSRVVEREPIPSPRPAAGMPPVIAAPAQHDVLPPTQPFRPEVHVAPQHALPGSFPPVGGAPPVHPHFQAPYGTVPPGLVPPQQPGFYPPQYPQPPLPPPAAPDQGLRALVALIVFLAVALAIVVLLLVIRR